MVIFYVNIKGNNNAARKYISGIAFSLSTLFYLSYIILYVFNSINNAGYILVILNAIVFLFLYLYNTLSKKNHP